MEGIHLSEAPHRVWITAKPLGRLSKTALGLESSVHKFVDLHHTGMTKNFLEGL
jgi:hypothetical protein